MKARIARIGTLATVFLALGSTLATAADAPADVGKRSNEYERQQNRPAPLQGTSASRQAERQSQREGVKQQARRGELPKVGDDWGMNRNQPQKATGTHASRVAERGQKREQMRELVKTGEMPITSEAEVGATKKR